MQFLLQTTDQKRTMFFNLSVIERDQYVFLNLEEQEPQKTLMQIHNETEKYEIAVAQYDILDCYFTVGPKQRIPFAWREPMGNLKILIRLVHHVGQETHISDHVICLVEKLDKTFTEQVMFRTFKNEIVSMSYELRLEGGAKVLKIFNNKNQIKVAEVPQSNWMFSLNIASLGISLISSTKNTKKSELFFLYLNQLKVVLMNEKNLLTAQIAVQTLSLDNNFSEEINYPVTLFPRPAKKGKTQLASLNILLHIKNPSQNADVSRDYTNKSQTIHFGLIQVFFDDLIFSLDGLTLNAISDYVRSVTKVMKQVAFNENVEVHQYYFMDQQERTVRLFHSNLNKLVY